MQGEWVAANPGRGVLRCYFCAFHVSKCHEDVCGKPEFPRIQACKIGKQSDSSSIWCQSHVAGVFVQHGPLPERKYT